MNNIKSNKFGALLSKKDNIRYKKKEKIVNNENKSNNFKDEIINKKINNYFKNYVNK